MSVYDNFGSHFYEDDPIDGHTGRLIKLVLHNYFKTRIHCETIKKNESSHKLRIRSINTKSILFRNE